MDYSLLGLALEPIIFPTKIETPRVQKLLTHISRQTETEIRYSITLEKTLLPPYPNELFHGPEEIAGFIKRPFSTDETYIISSLPFKCPRYKGYQKRFDGITTNIEEDDFDFKELAELWEEIRTSAQDYFTS